MRLCTDVSFDVHRVDIMEAVTRTVTQLMIMTALPELQVGLCCGFRMFRLRLTLNP